MADASGEESTAAGTAVNTDASENLSAGAGTQAGAEISMEAQGWARLAELEPKAMETFQDWEMTFTQPGKSQIDGGRVFFRAHKIKFDKAPGSLVSSGRLIYKAHRLTPTTDPNTWVRPVLPPYNNPVKGWRRRVEEQAGVNLQVGGRNG